MFVAHDQDGNSVSLIGLDRNSALKLKNSGPYFCPACKKPVFMKAGRQKLPHFAHLERCPVKPGGESGKHLAGKKALFHWLVKNGYEVRLEQYLPEIQQRPDLLIHAGQRLIALEFQVSEIPVDSLVARTKAYSDYGVFPIWILDAGLIRERQHGILDFSDFLAFFIQRTSVGLPSLYTLDPERRIFMVYTNLFPYSPQRAFSERKDFPLEVNVKTICRWQPPPVRFYDYWYPMMEKWLIGLTVSRSARRDPFINHLYKHQIHPLQLPPEVGLPVRDLHLIKTPAFTWQGFIWHHFLYNNQDRRASFTLADVRRFLFVNLKGMVKKRLVASLWQDAAKTCPVEHYLRVLCELGYLKNDGQRFTIGKKARLIHNPNREREVLMKDFYRRNKGIIVRSLLLTK